MSLSSVHLVEVLLGAVELVLVIAIAARLRHDRRSQMESRPSVRYDGVVIALTVNNTPAAGEALREVDAALHRRGWRIRTEPAGEANDQLKISLRGPFDPHDLAVITYRFRFARFEK